ncbi:MAG: DUF1501 domain-containing protein [Akkermansiaceae bacterium]|nr:DUF1501 domain-containing protein [Akkermansiaceae bacterium]
MINHPQFPILSRRQMLARMGGGFGLLGLSGALNNAGLLTASASEIPVGTPHFAPKAKRVIFLMMNGGPSHVDTFDPKPALAKHEGETPGEQAKNKKKTSGYMPSPFEFKPRGQCGMMMSELFPQLSRHADDLCLVRSMHTDQPNHEPGLLIMQSGNPQPVRPSIGSWISYGLGTENENLPSYVAISPGRPVVGPQLWSNAFLPGEHQATAVDTNNLKVDQLIANLRHPKLNHEAQRRQVDLLGALNRLHSEQRQRDAALETEIKSMELAYAMQAEAAEAFDVSREPDAVRDRYGRTSFGQSCLLARRLAESGVRFTQVFYVDKKNKQPWDTHQDNDGGHRRLCADSDRASAALLTDLKERGLLEDTLVIWGGEFGRTPYSQIDKKKSKPGRDHHHTAFSMLLAGGGIKPGTTYGTTDEFGMHVAENPVHVHDLHATILNQLGINHEKLTYRYSGRDFRLTDIHGEVVQGILS